MLQVNLFTWFLHLCALQFLVYTYTILQPCNEYDPNKEKNRKRSYMIYEMQIILGASKKKGLRWYACGSHVVQMKKCTSWREEVRELLSITDGANVAHDLFLFILFISICCSICSFFRGVSLYILFHLDIVLLGVTHKKSGGLAI